jgi:hypothetical protein
MTSSALTYWRSDSGDRLDELLAAHKLMEGTGRGRRWRTEGLNAAMVLRLAAEFQGFARRLHDLGCDTFATWAAPTNVAVRAVILNQLREARQIDRRNAQPESLGSDFGRFGFRLWPALHARDSRSKRYQESLERLNTAATR